MIIRYCLTYLSGGGMFNGEMEKRLRRQIEDLRGQLDSMGKIVFKMQDGWYDHRHWKYCGRSMKFSGYVGNNGQIRTCAACEQVHFTKRDVNGTTEQWVKL